MNLSERCAKLLALYGLSFAIANGAYAQVSAINSVIVRPHYFRDVPTAIFAGVTNYPSLISFSEQNVSQATGFADRDIWQFSTTGTNAYKFQNDDFFQATFDLILTGGPTTPRKEAGFVFSFTSETGGDLQFFVNTDQHEVVQIGGIGFYSFSQKIGLTYKSGDKITLGLTYFMDANGKRALMFSANGIDSPVQEFPSGGIGTGTLGGYFQIVNDPNNPTNSGSAVFQNIKFSPPPPLVNIASVATAGNQQVVFWPAAATNFVLQSTTNLSAPNWTTVTKGTPIIGVTVSNTTPETFYRLAAP
jgi:hypothetical protein